MKLLVIAVPTLVSGDAIGNDVMIEYRLLKNEGHNIKIFAENYQEQFSEFVCSFEEAIKADIVFYHHGIYWALGEKLLKKHKGKIRILRYHNVTPVEFFKKYSPDLANIVEIGRQQTRRLIKLSTHFLADSNYNAQELLSDGASSKLCKILAPFHHVDELISAESDIMRLEYLTKGKKPNILFVGRQVPNKGMHHFIYVAKEYTRFFGKKANFIWIGGKDPTFELYYEEVQGIINKNNLDDIISFPGKIPINELKSYYLSSSIFLVISEHEGFGVPIIEAQALGVPIVALNRAAVGDTAGDDQLLFDDIDYERFAVAIEVLLNNTDYRLKLIEKGKENFNKRFEKSILEKNFIEILMGVLKR